MPTYAAYDAGLPCKNSDCKSHGKPHPNCHCYDGNMAEGGEVGHFCSGDRPHDKSCEYSQHQDPELSVASHLGQSGLHGLLSMESNDPAQMFKYNMSVKKGHKKLHSKIERLFKNGPSDMSDNTKAKKTVEEWLDKGGINHDIQQEIYKSHEPQKLAAGGEVKHREGIPHHAEIANAYPEQNVSLQAAKGRMSNYLNSLKPQKNAPKLAFDDEPDTTTQEKSYKRALDISVDPLSILDKIRSGKIEQEHIKHFKNMYPEVDQVLQKKLGEGIANAQLAKEKPDFHVRQGLSMLLGAPLSGELSHQNMMAAQAVFAAKQPQQPQGQPPKKTSALSKTSQGFLLPSQAAAGRQQIQK